MSRYWRRGPENDSSSLVEKATLGTGETEPASGFQGTGTAERGPNLTSPQGETPQVFYGGGGTEGVEAIPPYSRTVQFGDLDITVLLSGEDKFLGIMQVESRRNFLSPAQELSKATYFDFDDLFKE